MSPVVDGQVKVGGEIYLYPEFWKKIEETIYSSLFFDKLEQSLEGAEELPWYDIREYKLDEARTDKLITEFPGRGDCLRVLEYTSGASASIKFDSPTSPSFTLPKYEKIRWGFNKLYLTNTAQSGKKIEILFAKGNFDLKKAIQPIEPFGELANENLAVLTDWSKIADELIIARHIAAHVIDANKLNVATHILSGATWTNNSPGAGYIAWSGAKVTYNGATYTITNGNTDKKYISWDFSLSTTTFQVSDTQPTLTDDDFIVVFNDSGTHILIWNSTLVDGRNIRTGTIHADAYYELRNTYMFNDQDSLDASYPFEMDFKIVSEMTAIVSVKLSFRIRNFRAYATTVPSGGGHTTPSGGGHTTPSGGGHTTPSGGGSTSGATGSASGGGSTSGSATHDHAGSTADGAGSHSHNIPLGTGAGVPVLFPGGEFTTELGPATNVPTASAAGSHSHSLNISADGAHTHTTPDHTHPNHTHTTPSHTHTVSDHQHAVSNHQHTVSNHTHSLTFGIYEDAQSPTLTVKIDNGAGYGASIGSYNADQLDIDITAHISGTGFKRIKFESDVRTRISGMVECKIDLTA